MLTPTGLLALSARSCIARGSEWGERAARTLSAGWEAEIRIAVEILFPTWLLLECLDRFGVESPQTRVEVIESVLGGTGEALLQGQADLAISPQIPPGFLGDPLMHLRAIPVAHPNHPLHQLKRKLTLRDLRAHRHIVVRDSGTRRTTGAMDWRVDQRWAKVSIYDYLDPGGAHGLWLAWLAEERSATILRLRPLKPLPLREGSERFADSIPILADRDAAGPGTLRLAEIIREGNCQRVRQARTQHSPATADTAVRASDR